MQLNIRLQSLTLIVCSMISTLSRSQDDPSGPGQPDLDHSEKTIENVISIGLPENKLRKLHSTRGNKIELNPDLVLINGDTVKAKKIRTRGQSTLYFKRKSLQFKLKSKASFRHGDRTKSLKKFYLLNLSMDKYYCHNRLAFEMMDSIGLFGLFYSFGELRINGNSEGIYMVIERPEDWAFMEKDSPVVLRRGPDHAVDNMKTDDPDDRGVSKTYLNHYRNIYSALDLYSGNDLYEALSEFIDLEFYMKWMAFNFLIHNGDYADEVFFFIDPEILKFRIIPWDYDDILANSPHEGIHVRNQTIGEKLVFSSEDRLDEKIAMDPYLYQIYLDQLNEVLNRLSPDLLKIVTEHTYAELYPYYTHPEIISNVQFDYYKDASMANLRAYLSEVYKLMNHYRGAYLKALTK